MLPNNQEGAIYCEISYGIMLNMWRFEDESSHAYLFAAMEYNFIINVENTLYNSTTFSTMNWWDPS